MELNYHSIEALLNAAKENNCRLSQLVLTQQQRQIRAGAHAGLQGELKALGKGKERLARQRLYDQKLWIR